MSLSALLAAKKSSLTPPSTPTITYSRFSQASLGLSDGAVIDARQLRAVAEAAGLPDPPASLIVEGSAKEEIAVSIQRTEVDGKAETSLVFPTKQTITLTHLRTVLTAGGIPDTDLSHICDNLYIASLDAVEDMFERMNGEAGSAEPPTLLVVNAAPTLGYRSTPPTSLTVHSLPLLDTVDSSLLPLLPDLVRILQGALQSDEGGRVIVHCHAGVSRAPSLVAAYLMWAKNMTFDEALTCIRGGRPKADPNVGFRRQLKEWGEQCEKERRAES